MAVASAETRTQRRGSALVLVLTMVTIVLGTLSLLMVAIANQAKHGGMSQILARALTAADNGVAMAKSKILEDPTAYAGAVGTTVLTANNASVLIWEESSTASSYVYRLESTGTVAGRSRKIQLIVELKQNTKPLELVAGFPAAIVSTGTIDLAEDVRISGNDHDNDGNYPGKGAHGDAIDVSGGGGGTLNDTLSANAKMAANNLVTGPAWDINSWYSASKAARVQENPGSSFWGANPFPTRVGHLFGFADEAPLIEAAKATGTYFSGANADKDWDDWRKKINDGSGYVLSGKVIYIEIDNSDGAVPVDHLHMGRASGSDVTGENPSIFIVTGKVATDHNVTLTKFHVKSDKLYSGLVIVDEITSIESGKGGTIVGGLFLFNSGGTTTIGEALEVKYSSEVLINDDVNGSGTNLPGVSDPTAPWDFNPILWREIPN